MVLLDLWRSRAAADESVEAFCDAIVEAHFNRSGNLTHV